MSQEDPALRFESNSRHCVLAMHDRSLNNAFPEFFGDRVYGRVHFLPIALFFNRIGK